MAWTDHGSYARPVRVLVVGTQLAGPSSRAHRHTLLYFAFVLLFPLHAPILKPYLDLSFGQTQGMGYLDTSSASQVAVEVELLLELQCLVPSVRLAASLAF